MVKIDRTPPESGVIFSEDNMSDKQTPSTILAAAVTIAHVLPRERAGDAESREGV